MVRTRTSSLVLVLLAALLVAFAQAADKSRPFTRLQSTTGGAAGTTTAAEEEEGGQDMRQPRAHRRTTGADGKEEWERKKEGWGRLFLGGGGGGAQKNTHTHAFPLCPLTHTPHAPHPTMLEPLRPSEKVAFLQKVAKNGVDPLELFTRGVNSKGFKVLLKNAEIQHRILEEMPLLAAFDGFKQITGRRLSDEEVRCA